MISKQQRNPNATEETFEEHLGNSWQENQMAMREARRAAAQRRLDQIINP